MRIIGKRFLILTILCIVGINIIFFIAPINLTSILFFVDGFIIFFALVMLLAFYYTFKKGSDKNIARSRFFGWPIVQIGIIFFILSAFINIALLIFSQFYHIALWIVVIINVILLIMVFSGLIVTDSNREFIDKQRVKREISTLKMKELRLQSSKLVTVCTNPKLQKELKAMADMFRYSDPNSDKDVALIEETIKSELYNLENLIGNIEDEQAFEKIKKIKNLLKIRNQMVLDLK